MDLFKSLSNFIKNKEETVSNTSPEGLCPNCWGRQEYSGQFYMAIKNEGIDINTVDSKKGWVQEYAEKHLHNIQLKQENENVACPKCKITYRPAN